MFGLFNPVLPCKTGGEGADSCSYTETTTFLGIPIRNTDVTQVCPDEGQYACCDSSGATCVEDGESEPDRVDPDHPVLAANSS